MHSDVRCATVLVLVIIIIGAFASATGDGSEDCDWAGSGLDYNEEERSVRPVYVRCNQGTITWKYPKGALRIVLRHGNGGRSFRACVRPQPNVRGVRIFIEGHRTLLPLYDNNDIVNSNNNDNNNNIDAPLPVRCFYSVHGQAAVYVEAERQDDSSALQRKQTFQLNYDLTLLPVDSHNRIIDPDEECRPCSDEELLTLFCTTDFAAIGHIVNVKDNSDKDVTELKVRSKQVLWQRTSVFTKERKIKKNNANNKSKSSDSEEDELGHWSATLQVPRHCGASRGGDEEFLLIGRLLLGEPRLLCAPRRQQWDYIRADAIAAGTQQCNIQ